MTKHLTLKQILEADDRPTQEVEVPEWSADPENPETVLLAPMTSAEWDALQAKFVEGKAKGLALFNATIVANCMVDEDGKRVIPPGKIAALAEKSAPVMSRLGEVCQRINGLKKEDVDELAGE